MITRQNIYTCLALLFWGATALFSSEEDSDLNLNNNISVTIKHYKTQEDIQEEKIEVKTSDTIESLKQKISQRMQIPVEEQVLIFRKNKIKTEDNGRRLSFYKIINKSQIPVVRLSQSNNPQPQPGYQPIDPNNNNVGGRGNGFLAKNKNTILCSIVGFIILCILYLNIGKKQKKKVPKSQINRRKKQVM